jgi:hypothetical protein
MLSNHSIKITVSFELTRPHSRRRIRRDIPSIHTKSPTRYYYFQRGNLRRKIK